MFSQSLIKKFESLETPFYYYDMEILENNLKCLKKITSELGYHVHYALKANANPPVLTRIADFGFGADCVSGNEILRALECGFSPEKIVLAGVGKKDSEIALALKHNILCINCESIQELQIINKLASRQQKTAPVALRVNPDLEAGTHRYITTGLNENKFGINFKDLESVSGMLSELNHIRIIGLHTHIGSQILNLEVFRNLALRINDIQNWFQERNITFEHLNLGGGLGVNYQNPDENILPDYQKYFELISSNLNARDRQQVHFELGRSMVAQCGALISRVLYVKKGLNRKFAIIDAGMTELIRPALYNAYHKIENLTSSGPLEMYDVVGPVCESSDFLGKKIALKGVRRGDILAIRTTGAYAEVMSSGYNLRDRAPAIYSDQL
ncbi:MAG: diaminopimelate decarboxylase [Calditrichaeota bacterium]|nr:diaminopimelate decarboxylase [Calditrichota bacterium]RQW02190.1 MAG: diaminopimelate decarboxylase [Calditrichota bacterium]